MRKTLPLAAFVATVLMAGQVLAAGALSTVVTESVRDCRGGEGSNLPLITWGGDMTTIYGNGDSLTTTSNSIFGKAGLKLTLKREDKFAKQVAALMRCDTPYVRGTIGQINMAADVTEKDPRTKLVVVYQHSWSAGGDGIVGNKGIKKPADLKGKRIALQEYGPHVDYLFRMLADAGLKPSDVTLVWMKELTGGENDPSSALLDGKADAAMVIIPDALALTSGGKTGTGAEGSKKGATIMLSTKSASRIIADAYAVRKDYFDANRAEVKQFVDLMIKAEDELRKLVRAKDTRKDEYKKMIVAAASILLDAPTAIADTEGLYADAETTGKSSNKRFFKNKHYPRGFAKLNKEIQTSLVASGLLGAPVMLEHAGWNYASLGVGVTTAAVTPKFNTAAITQVVMARAASGNDDSLFSFEINFKPNQKKFPIALYRASFKKVIDLASTYAGAVITVAGHSDPYGYQKKKRKGAGQAILGRIEQAARNLSISRSNAVRDAIITMAAASGVTLDKSQFVAIGLGISSPKNSKVPTTKEEWKKITAQNRRVVFELVNIEAESVGFEAP